MLRNICLIYLFFWIVTIQSIFPMGNPFIYTGITAHRGNSFDFPENTIPAFESAIELGVDWVELDIHRTKDGKIVVSHDANTYRAGDKTLEISASNYSELLTVDVATGFRKGKGKNLQECLPCRMPLLEDVLTLFIKQSKSRISIQPKTDCVAQAIDIIKKMGALHSVGFNDGNLKYMSMVKTLAPDIPVFWDRPANSNIDEDISIARNRGFESIIINYDGITPEKIQKLKVAGLEAGVWTVNDREAMKHLLNIGVQRIYTDDPRSLIAIQAGLRTIACEGIYPMHLQGICTDGKEAIFWSWTNELIKTDMQGKILTRMKVQSHHGDLCYVDGKVYVAVNLGKFNQSAGQSDSRVYVYDAGNLLELKRYALPELVHGAGGIAFNDGKFIVVGGLVPGTNENYLYEYDTRFVFRKRHVLESGYTLMGIQTITYADGYWWLGCYGKPDVLLRADDEFRLDGRWDFNASVGLTILSEGSMLIGKNVSKKGEGNTGSATIYYTFKR